MASQYYHQSSHGHVLPFPVGKVLCIGQNYSDHIAELNSIQRPEPLFFIKPNTSLAALSRGVTVPKNKGECHNELELAVLIQKKLTCVTEQQVEAAIWGYGLALDLTLRQIQARQKKQGRPWEVAKGFDASCPITPFIPKTEISEPQNSQITLLVNGKARQNGNTAQMLRPIYQLISEMSHEFTLLPGDIVLTGTPAGVGPLVAGDKLNLSLASGDKNWQFHAQVY
ncbi:MAG: fumarylacetoacetate hydrolase family protein [Gammaproteobacteria bacterium]|nr:fumarylacetoacetate hydrolase family protein [Gammaproteobacteria bacterium]